MVNYRENVQKSWSKVCTDLWPKIKKKWSVTIYFWSLTKKYVQKSWSKVCTDQKKWVFDQKFSGFGHRSVHIFVLKKRSYVQKSWAPRPKKGGQTSKKVGQNRENCVPMAKWPKIFLI